MSRRKESHRACAVDGCSKHAASRGYCADHHRQAYGGSSSSGSRAGGASSLLDAGAVGCDDMILLPSPSERTITENLAARHKRDIIYTYIGHVLVSVNPFKPLPIYTPAAIATYTNKAVHENAPHVFALAEMAYKTMRNEEENQCVIISGESGAGKTEASKQIMSYISAVSGGGSGADAIKNMILESNPLLEALGNAKTIRNNNSSRFGKYFEIRFDATGVPRAGHISNYLLEKSRVVHQGKDERSYHIFYQLIKGAPAAAREKYSLTGGCADFAYLAASGSNCHSIADVDDVAEFEATRHALKVTGFGSKEQEAVFSLIAGVLHLGNLRFKEDERTGACKISSTAIAAELLGIDSALLGRIIKVRHIKTAREEYDVPNNAVQCAQARDAIAKALYARMFDWVVRRVNSAIANEELETPFSIGVLDIYGFEVFSVNGFDQFNINYVNEKLQQIFIERTLKNEQEEYAREGIEWKQIQFFNNKVVCELIEGSLSPSIRLPPGIFSLLDDVCATMHAESKGSDKALADKVMSIHGGHAHLASAGSRIGFLVRHYAGEVEYAARDFPEKNADAVSNDIMLAMQSSSKRLIPILFPEEVDLDSKKKPPTSGQKIRAQTKKLVADLMASNPHYIRTIKSNDAKRADFFDAPRVQFQVKYLGLLENLRVRRAGFAYRREFHDFVKRFAILSKKTWPNEYSGSDKDAAKHILTAIKKSRPDLVTKDQVQLGKTMLFVKDPETLNEFDLLKLDRLGSMVVKFQRLWRHYKANKDAVATKNATALFLYKAHKERRRESFYRPYNGIYIDAWKKDTQLVDLLHRHEQKDHMRVVFIDRVDVISSNSAHPMAHLREAFPSLFAAQVSLSAQFAHWRRELDMILVITKENVFFIQHQRASSSPRVTSPTGAAAVAASAAFVPTYFLRRVIPLTALSHLTLTTLADTYLALHVQAADATKTRPAAPWRPDKEVSNCRECGDSFGLFRRRHHCRACGDILCWACTQRTVVLPDRHHTPPTKEPVRICSFCFGGDSADYMQDVLLSSDKRTEIMVVLQDLFKKSPLKTIDVKFSNTISLALREHDVVSPTPVLSTREVSFKSSKHAAPDDFSVASNSHATVKAPSGLAPDFIKAVQRRAEKRRAATERRKEAERIERQRRAAERDAEREIERKARLAEKKRLKAEAKAAAAAAPTEQPSSSGRPSSSRTKQQVVVHAAPAIPACSTCGCGTFVPNIFKPGKCNACFHPH